MGKTAEAPTVSRPILISRPSGKKGKERQVAQSCPTFSTVPPPAPASKPSVPFHDPPALELPPSPPVFSPMQVQAAQNQLAQVKQHMMSRSLTHYSSSCPDVSWLTQQMQQAGNRFPGIAEIEPVPIKSNSNSEQSNSNSMMVPPRSSGMGMESLDGMELGKSPTIFSLLQGTSAPSSRATSFIGDSANMGGPSGSLLSASNMNTGPSSRTSLNPPVSFDNGPDMPEDDLLFAISLDQHDSQDSYLAESAGAYLHM